MSCYIEDGQPYAEDGTPMTWAEFESWVAADPESIRQGQVGASRAALTAALALMAAGPLDDAGRAQVDAALVQYRALPTDPAADVVDLANRVSTHIQSNGYLKAQQSTAQHAAAETAFLADPTVTLPQVIEQVRLLTRMIRELRAQA